jgi:hypothetical protein
MNRDEAIKRIRAALKKRSGKPWSVTHGRGTVWGWITISSPPARRTSDYEGGFWHAGMAEGCYYLTREDGEELARLLALPARVHPQGQSIAAGNDYYQEYVDRAEGRTPTVYGKPYWD